MVANASPQRLTRAPRTRLAVLGGGLVALGFILMPGGLLERLVLASGIPAVLAAAEPPLGFTARIALGGTLGGLVAGFMWFGLGLLGEDDRLGKAVTALLGGGDRHPDAPPRKPLSASRELGEPAVPPAPPVEQPLPADLDQPLAAYDPHAIPAVPLARPQAVAPLAPLRPQPIDPGDRFEAFETPPLHRPSLAAPAEPSRPLSLRVSPVGSLRTQTLRDCTPTPTPTPAPAPPPATAAVAQVMPQASGDSVHALLARLERGLAAAPPRRAIATPPPEPVPALRAGRFEDTLGDLRKLAAGSR